MSESIARKLGYTMDTIEDLKALPETTRAELIGGEIQMMASPSDRHQSICGALYAEIRQHIKQHGGTCEPRIAPLDVYLDDENVYEPDVFVVCDPSKLQEDGCHGAPDFVIEVLSKSTRRYDKIVKMVHYMSTGVREYWAVDPDAEMVFVFNADDVLTYRFDEAIPVGIYEGFSIKIAEIL